MPLNEENKKEYQKKWRKNNPEYQKEWRKNKKERRGELIPTGVNEHSKRKPYPEEYKKRMSKIFLGRKIINGHWAERGEKKMGNEKNNFLHVAIEFLEKMKEKEDIDIDMINDWKGKITTLGEAIARDFEKAMEAKQKPVRISFAIGFDSKNKEDREKFKNILNCFYKQMLKPTGYNDPETKTLLSEMTDKNYSDVCRIAWAVAKEKDKEE